jgi:hypothetical protein
MKIGKLGPFSFFKNSILTHKKWIFVCVKMIFSDKKKCKKKNEQKKNCVENIFIWPIQPTHVS